MAAKELTGYVLSVGIVACMIIIIYAIIRGVSKKITIVSSVPTP